MKTFHPDLKAHLAGHTTTVCHAWIVTRSDGISLGFTDHDCPLAIGGVSCEPQTGFSAGAAEASLGLSGDMSDVAGALSSDRITGTDIERGLYDGADITLYLVNWQAPETASPLRRFHIGEITRQGSEFRAELRSLSATLDQPRGRYFTRQCDAVLGDGRCTVDLNRPGLSADGAIAVAVSRYLLELSGIGAFEAGWFDFGTIRFQSGVRVGDVLSIASARPIAGGKVQLTFTDPQHVLPEAGDVVRLFAGCDKRFATCKAKFANPLNFRGFPHMPGDDRALGYVRADGVFDGGPIVP